MSRLRCRRNSTAGNTVLLCREGWPGPAPSELSTALCQLCSRAFIRAAADDEDLAVPSPTYLLQNIYDAHEGVCMTLHVYRLSPEASDSAVDASFPESRRAMQCFARLYLTSRGNRRSPDSPLRFVSNGRLAATWAPFLRGHAPKCSCARGMGRPDAGKHRGRRSAHPQSTLHSDSHLPFQTGAGPCVCLAGFRAH